MKTSLLVLSLAILGGCQAKPKRNQVDEIITAVKESNRRWFRAGYVQGQTDGICMMAKSLTMQQGTNKATGPVRPCTTDSWNREPETIPMPRELE
jgi:hypothetical protein